ncbi:hypothetical protein [Sediminibacterium goheungense]|uniref:Lipocalin-like protein n=1 Tax=Sediminibacterium goheungense TaxID=1086393 RepID=A0A4R6J1S4_9BACT|nr:hypothetical protein [Sediminibacterium goheungense]TDO28807.1 hypothetical protein BC659_0887 [Sediminibacterium goheungense]
MRKEIYIICSLLISLTYSLESKSQQIQSERKLITGTWVSTEGDWTFTFENDSICKEFLVKKLQGKYLYKITSANSYCGKLSQVDVNDKTISYLQLNNVETKEITCYENNGVSKTTLSITEYMMPEAALFKRKLISKKGK